MKISIASYSFHGLINAGMMDVFGYLESCRYRYNLDAADIWNGLMGKDPQTYLQPEFTAKVKQALDDRELVLCNYHADGCHPWEADAAVRDKHHELALRHLSAAEAMGAKTMRIDAGGREPKWTSEQFDHIVKRYKQYAKRAYDNGYRVGPENHWGAEMNPDNMVKLCKAVDHPGFGVLLHLSRWDDHSGMAGDKKVMPWVMHTHVFDGDTKDQLDVALKMLLDGGYRGYFDVETGVGKHEYEQVGYLIAMTRRALARIGHASLTQGGRNELIPTGVQDYVKPKKLAKKMSKNK